MSRVNKLTESVFGEIIGTESQVSKIKQFLTGIDLNDNSSQISIYAKEYQELINEILTDLNLLAHLEKIILQLKARESINDIKLSIVREYIYARCSFYRDDKVTKDIRIIADKTEFWGDNVEKLQTHPLLMGRAKNKLIYAMNDEISKSVINYEKYKTTIE